MNILTSIKIYFVLSLGLCFFLSCREEKDHSITLLNQAQKIAESDPKRAFVLLDSIGNPEAMVHDKYMQYIVARVQTKYKTYQRVASDTLIFHTQKYFEEKNKFDAAALACYYSSAVYYESGKLDEALKCLLSAENFAKKTVDNMLIGKSLHGIANLYFERDVMDSAIVRSKEALNYYNKDNKSDSYKLQVLNLIGRAYQVNNNLDSSYFYFNKALDLANKINNESYSAILTYNIGVVFLRKKKYNESTKYLYQALRKKLETEDSLKVYLNLSEVYNGKRELDSAKYYTDLIKERLSGITDNYVLHSVYGSLCDYNKQSGNYQEALYYADLQKDASRRIVEADNSQKLLAVEKAYQMSLKEKELAAVEMRSYLYLSIGIFIVLLIWLTGYFRNRNMRNKHEQEVEKNRLLKKQYDQQVESLAFLKNIYRTITSEWTAIDREVDSLAIEYGAREKPTIYMRIKELIDNLKQDTNERLIKWTKNHLEKNPFGEKIIPQLNDNDLLLLGLSCYGYEKSEIADILGIPIQKVHTRKLALRHDFRKVGMPDSLIDELLFTNND